MSTTKPTAASNAAAIAELQAGMGAILQALQGLQAPASTDAPKGQDKAPAKDKAPALPKRPIIDAHETYVPAVARIRKVLGATKVEAAGTYPLPARTAKGAPAGATWRKETVHSQIAETFVDLGISAAKEWADLASNGHVNSVAIIAALRAPKLEK